MKYTCDAFISYRHLPAEMAVAEKLPKLLESRKKKNGKKTGVFSGSKRSSHQFGFRC